MVYITNKNFKVSNKIAEITKFLITTSGVVILKKITF